MIGQRYCDDQGQDVHDQRREFPWAIISFQDLWSEYDFKKINAFMFPLTLRKTILDFVSSSWSRSWESFNASLAVWGETPKIHWMKIPQALSFCFILLKLFLKPLDIWTQVLNFLGMDSLKVHIWNSLFAPSLDSFGEMIVNYQLFPSPISKAASVFTICHISAAVSGYHQI